MINTANVDNYAVVMDTATIVTREAVQKVLYTLFGAD